MVKRIKVLFVFTLVLMISCNAGSSKKPFTKLKELIYTLIASPDSTVLLWERKHAETELEKFLDQLFAGQEDTLVPDFHLSKEDKVKNKLFKLLDKKNHL